MPINLGAHPAVACFIRSRTVQCNINSRLQRLKTGGQRIALLPSRSRVLEKWFIDIRDPTLLSVFSWWLPHSKLFLDNARVFFRWRGGQPTDGSSFQRDNQRERTVNFGRREMRNLILADAIERNHDEYTVFVWAHFKKEKKSSFTVVSRPKCTALQESHF